MCVADLARARLEQQLMAFRTHADAVPAGDDPEAIHQMRVATRRLRAALRVFADVLPPEAIELGGELKWLFPPPGGRVRRAGARLTEDAPPAELHRARIRTKQLRYTLECFTDLYGGPARKLVRRAT